MCSRKMMTRFCFKAAMLLAAFVAIAYASPADAAFMSCRADPIVFLSDGTKITITAQVATNASNVQQVQYTLHVPLGNSVDRIIFTAGGLGKKESVTVYADSAPGTYVSDTVVTTKGDSVQVQAKTTLGGRVLGVATGYSKEHLIVSLSATPKVIALGSSQ